MASTVMEAEPREHSGKGPNRRLRAAGRVPAVLYGNNLESVALSVDPKEVVSIIRSHGGVNTIFELSIKGKKGTDSVMIKEFQLEPVEHALLHADFVRVAMDKEMMLSVAIELIGIPEGVKTDGGTLDFVTRNVDVACLPKDIPETLVAEIASLEIGDYVRASDLGLPSGVELVSAGNIVIAHVLAPKVEEEETPEEGEGAAEGAEGGEAPAAEESSGEGSKE